MNKIFSNGWKYFAGGATVLSYNAWYEQLKSPQKSLEMKNEINSNFNTIRAEISHLQEKITSNIDEGVKIQLREKVKDLTSNLYNMDSINKKYFNNFENGIVSENSEASLNLYTKYKSQIDETFSEANNKAIEIIDILDKLL